ncbi:GyrI-like domain-containing protein [Sphingobacterium hotanense]|uniref:GyrI-like domain-containing protein n=1 Tax=Sphingobacterium hotanense TaxID=649196 RepID=UPI0011F2D2FB|nr:effector binding domain-containing protein [Sphingobacterium hotanense]
MSTETIEQFYVIGISTRTCNKNRQAAEDIEALWVKFWNENIQERIPNKSSEDIYVVYNDYESDFNHAYTTIIGRPVTSLEQIPDGFVGVTIEEAKYEKFVSKGKMPEAVGKTWFEIWANTDLNRAYKADFTVHGKKYYDGDQAEVETFISVMD